MPLAGFEPVVPASKLPQTLNLDRSATGLRCERRGKAGCAYD